MIPALFGGIVLAALAWAQFRSFDLLDAATHFLTYQYPGDNPDTHTRYHLLARPVWLLCGGNIVAFRLCSLGLLGFAALVFWRQWRSALIDPDGDGWAALALGAATLAGAAWLPVLLGYNSLSTFFGLLTLAALPPLLDRRTVAPASGRSPPIIPAIGCMAGIVLTALAKPPAALALVTWGGFLVLTLRPWPRIVRWSGVIAPLVALAVGAVLMNRWIAQHREDPIALLQFAGLQLRPRWILETLQRYGTELAGFLPALGRDIVGMIAPACGLAGLVLWRQRRADLPVWAKTAGLIAFFAALLANVIFRGLWDGSFAKAVSGEMARLYLLLWAAVLPAWLAAWRRSPRDELPGGLLAMAFFFLPLTCGFGSTNTPYFSALHWTVFWTFGLLVVSRSIAGALAAPLFHRIFTGTLIAAALSHLWTGHFLRPYMHQPSLWRQDVPVEIGHPATTLQLDATTAGFLTEVRAALDRHGYRPGDDVFGFFNIPGVIYAIGARQPGAPWYFGTWYGGDDTDGGKIRAVPEARRRRAWLITQADVSRFRREFLNCGIDFPDGYEKIGQTTNPSTGLEIGIWKPKFRP